MEIREIRLMVGLDEVVGTLLLPEVERPWCTQARARRCAGGTKDNEFLG
jgi:hypothetical protein